MNSITANGFCISSPEPTRSTDEYSSCLDHFIYQNLGKHVSVEVLEHQNFTDSNPVILTWRTSEDINKNDLMFRDTSFVKNQDAVSRYKMSLEAHLNKNSDIIYKSVDPCNAFSTFKQLFLKVTEDFAPLKSVDNKQKVPKWFDNRLKNLRQKRNHAYYKYKENKNDDLLKKFKECRMRLEKQLKLRKKQFHLNSFQKCLGNSRQTFKLLNELKGKSYKSQNFPILGSCYQKFDQPSDKNNANEFNNFFASIGHQVSRHLNKSFQPSFPRHQCSMYLYKTTAREVGDISTNLDNKSSSGVDDISNILIKLSSDVINPYLVFLINFSFDKGIFPKKLARARVLPLHKEGSKLDQTNYRPISLLVVISKIFEELCTSACTNILRNSLYFIRSSLVLDLNIVQLMH